MSNDNPYSEAAFETLKYCPAFPEVRLHRRCPGLLPGVHGVLQPRAPARHSGIGRHTPVSVHYGTALEIRAQRAATLDAAYAANPTRFTQRPQPPKLPTIAWINEPLEEVAQSA